MYNARLLFGERVVSIRGLAWSVAAGVVLAIALSATGRAEQTQLLSSWQDGDPGMRRVAEVIASAFASGSHGVLKRAANAPIALRQKSRTTRS